MKNIQLKPLTLRVVEKDTVPPANGLSPFLTNGLLYRDGGFWSMCTDEVISDVVQGGSVLMQWIPSRGVDTIQSNVAHLAWVGPDGFTGSTTYMEYLAGLADPGNCSYGPSDDWNAFEYAHQGFTVSRTSPTLTPEDFGSRFCDRQPVMRVRGDAAGINLENDAEWAMAKAGIGLEGHLNWNLIYGDPTIAKYTYDGLDVIIQPGWVSSKLIGGGSAVFSDPLVVNGVGLATPQAILQKVKGLVRKIRNRASQRGYTITANDMAIVLPTAIWTYIADAIALGLLMAVAPSNITVNITPEGFQRERERVTSGYYGFGFIPVDGIPVPVITEDTMGANVDMTITNEEDEEEVVAGVTGDIFILTRYFKGITILEHQFFNWNVLGNYPAENEVIQQNGMLRTGWVTEANKCFYYYAEMKARILSSFQPLQARINNVTVASLLENENESGSFGSQDWYAFDGERGGQGVALLAGAQDA